MKPLYVATVTLTIAVILMATGYGIHKYLTAPSSIEASGVKMIPAWTEIYGDSEKSHRDYIIWAIIQTAKEHDKRLLVLEDPNEVAK